MPDSDPIGYMTSSLTFDAIAAREEDAVVVDYFLKGTYSIDALLKGTYSNIF